jgi:hypothetical protein
LELPNFWKLLICHAKIWKKPSSTLSSLFSIMFNYKISLNLLLKVNHKTIVIISTLLPNLLWNMSKKVKLKFSCLNCIDHYIHNHDFIIIIIIFNHSMLCKFISIRILIVMTNFEQWNSTFLLWLQKFWKN